MSYIYKFRIYCETEQAYVFKWSITVPTECPNNSSHTIDANSIVITDSISEQSLNVKNLAKDNFGELSVIEKSTLISSKPSFGVSNLRDKITLNGTASLDKDTNNSIYELKTIASGDSVSLVTRERGRYVSGTSIEGGVGLRISSLINGSQILKWGLFDDYNGCYFKLTSTGLYVCILSNSVENAISQSSFNQDKADGTGKSGQTLNLLRGNIFKINYSWYGYGSISFSYQSYDSNANLQIITLHSFVPNGNVSIKNPNLPLSISLNNGTENTETTCFVSGREISLIGKYISLNRTTSIMREDVNINSTSYINILNIKKKLDGVGCGALLKELCVYSTTNQILQILYNTTLTNDSFVDITNTESVFQIDTSATAYSNGYVIWSTIIPANTYIVYNLLDNINITDREILSINVKASSATNGTINLVLRMLEEW